MMPKMTLIPSALEGEFSRGQIQARSLPHPNAFVLSSTASLHLVLPVRGLWSLSSSFVEHLFFSSFSLKVVSFFFF